MTSSISPLFKYLKNSESFDTFLFANKYPTTTNAETVSVLTKMPDFKTFHTFLNKLLIDKGFDYLFGFFYSMLLLLLLLLFISLFFMAQNLLYVEIY